MNTSALETFARDTRKAMMDAVERKLDYVLRADTADLRAAAAQVASLRESARRDRLALVERVAYTWFNRLAALRFLDARAWHPFGLRVITAAASGESQPELLKAFRDGALPDELARFTPVKRLNDLLDGHLPPAIAGADPQGEVYRHLILAACRYYHDRMPFLFEALDDETELLLPNDLLTTQSIAEGFRTEISDDDCGAVEVLGWLYQFYISGKKDQVMARKAAVPSADIPAVTQLFTPHWIVRYLVENSLGRLWLLNRPGSKLRELMPYFIEDAPAPNPQPPAPFPHLDRPEDIRLLDPACGSGHMLTYAFDLLYAIYEEEGYPAADIPGLILSHNLHGLEICPRATQLAQFALVCKARERNRNAFRLPVTPMVLCLRDVVFGPGELAAWIREAKVEGVFGPRALKQLNQFRENTSTFGSLIQPILSADEIAALQAAAGEQAPPGDLFLQDTHRKIRLVLDQAEMLSQRYQVVVTNPPYMGAGQMNNLLRAFAKGIYPDSSSDLFAVFIERALALASNWSFCSLITMQSWLFLPSYLDLRQKILDNKWIVSMAHLGPHGFRSIGGEVVQTAAFVVQNSWGQSADSSFFRLVDGRDEGQKERMYLAALADPSCGYFYRRCSSKFRTIPREPIAYWLSELTIKAFGNCIPLLQIAKTRRGLQTGDGPRFIREWFECASNTTAPMHLPRSAAIGSHYTWFPLNSGGQFRKWYGNINNVVLWKDNGKEIKATGRAIIPSEGLYFQEAITWSMVSAGTVSFRYQPTGVIPGNAGPCLYSDQGYEYLLGFLNSSLVALILGVMSPTMNYDVGTIANLPVAIGASDSVQQAIAAIAREAQDIAKTDWDSNETSWEFGSPPTLSLHHKETTLAATWVNWAAQCTATVLKMQELETENNRLWIAAYGLESEYSPEVPEDQITLARPDRRKDMAAFLSYAVGCSMGRYSLDKPGLILADAGDNLDQYLAKVGKPRETWRFAPDEDGIVPVLDGEWFGDDVIARVREFLRVTFGEASLDENLRFIEESLGKDLRAYFVTQFYKDHLQTYKKRPIYWLFQSPGKSFQCLVYLHRYTRDTVNRVLNRYLREYLAKLRAAISLREHTLASETASARDKTRARKEAEQYRKALRECEDWERSVLLPLAQQRVELDLDDGVKVNYLKLGEALAPIPGLAAPEEA